MQIVDRKGVYTMTLGQQWTGKIEQVSPHEVLFQQLNSRKLIDVGRITGVFEEGIVEVLLYDIAGTKLNCEVVSVGAFHDVLVQPQAGQNCIVFFPSSSTNLRTNEIDTSGGLYNMAYAKCLPIGIPGESNTVAIGSSEKSVQIQGVEYNVEFGESFVRLNNANILWSWDFATSTVSYSTADGLFTYQLTPTDFTLALGQEFDEKTQEATSCKAGFKIDVEGNVEFTQGAVIEDGAEKSWQSKFKLGADGSIDIKTLSAEEGKHQTEITIGTDGNITLKTLDGGEEKASLKIGHDGTINLTTTDAYSISGKAGVVVDGQDGKVSIKNGQKSLYEILKGTLQVLNSSFATQGSPGAHTCVPNQFQTQASDLDALME